MSLKLFLHGVPDTPSMWGPLISELGLSEEDYRAPAMPGFVTPSPDGFTSTKEAYVDWYISEIEQAHAESGPVDLVGHDWGAIITIRVASLRPDLVRTWCVANALPHPDYKWHSMARMWQTPIVGEIMTAITRKEQLCKALHAQGIPADLASHEASQWSPHMKKSILRLYRSAKTAGIDWWPEVRNVPKRGLVFWGVDDPCVPVSIAEKFCAETGAQLIKQEKTGHWSVIERAGKLAETLKQHWD